MSAIDVLKDQKEILESRLESYTEQRGFVKADIQSLQVDLEEYNAKINSVTRDLGDIDNAIALLEGKEEGE